MSNNTESHDENTSTIQELLQSVLKDRKVNDTYSCLSLYQYI